MKIFRCLLVSAALMFARIDGAMSQPLEKVIITPFEREYQHHPVDLRHREGVGSMERKEWTCSFAFCAVTSPSARLLPAATSIICMAREAPSRQPFEDYR